MALYTPKKDSPQNLLPYDGEVYYCGVVLTKTEADQFFGILLRTIHWKHDALQMFGKNITTKRKVAWYGDEGLEYTYTGRTKKALYWTPELLEIRNRVTEICPERFNSCLLNLYHTGAEGMGWHSDAEKDLVPNAAIASVSLGAERRFMFRHKESGETISLSLPHGSLLVMKGTTQTHWKHRLPPTTLIQSARINLTFRNIKQ